MTVIILGACGGVRGRLWQGLLGWDAMPWERVRFALIGFKTSLWLTAIYNTTDTRWLSCPSFIPALFTFFFRIWNWSQITQRAEVRGKKINIRRKQATIAGTEISFPLLAVGKLWEKSGHSWRSSRSTDMTNPINFIFGPIHCCFHVNSVQLEKRETSIPTELYQSYLIAL